jgi:hypothetical protein
MSAVLYGAPGTGCTAGQVSLEASRGILSEWRALVATSPQATMSESAGWDDLSPGDKLKELRYGLARDCDLKVLCPSGDTAHNKTTASKVMGEPR